MEVIPYQGFFKATGLKDGLLVGDEFTVQAGQPYDIEILISEYGGGMFQATLYVQDMSEKYRMDREKRPMLPFFKLKPSNMEAAVRTKLPPYERNAPIWTPASLAK